MASDKSRESVEEWPDNLVSMYNKALAYSKTNRAPEAIQQHEKVVELRKNKLGPDHPNTLSSMTRLALAYKDANQFTNAIALAKQALETAQAKFSPEDPLVLDCAKILAAIQEAQSGSKEPMPASARPATAGPSGNTNVPPATGSSWTNSLSGSIKQEVSTQMQLGFGTVTLMAPKKSIVLVLVSSRARGIGSEVPSVRVWRRQEALLRSNGRTPPLSGIFAVTNRPAGQKASARRRSGGSE